jgi:hypothetical protein
MDYYLKFQEMIDEYNTGAKNVDAFYTELISLAQNLNEEEARGMSDQFTLYASPRPSASHLRLFLAPFAACA